MAPVHRAPAEDQVLVPWLARVEAEQLYLPQDLIEEFIQPWKPEQTLEQIRRFERFYGPSEPVRAEKKTGRNAPCPCGSGKKFKQCCLKKEA